MEAVTSTESSSVETRHERLERLRSLLGDQRGTLVEVEQALGEHRDRRAEALELAEQVAAATAEADGQET